MTIEQDPELWLNDDKEKEHWKKIRDLRFEHASRERQVVNFFWDKTKEAYVKQLFLACSVLAGITAELAHKTKLREEGVKTNGKMWGKLIECEKDKETRRIAKRIKDDYRNVWVHADLVEIEAYLRSSGGPMTTDAALNIAFASAEKALDALEITKDFLSRLFEPRQP